MVTDQHLQSVRELALETAFEFDSWARLLEAVRNGFDAPVAVIGVVDTVNRGLVAVRGAGLADDGGERWREYSQSVRAFDLHSDYFTKFAVGSVYTDERYGLDAVDPAHPYVAWLEQKCGVLHHLSFALREQRLVGSIGVHRSRAAGAFDPSDRSRMEELSACLRHPLKATLNHMLLASDAYWNGLAGHSGRSIALVDVTGRVIRMSASFDESIASGGLDLRTDRIGATYAFADRRLQDAIRRAALKPTGLPIFISVDEKEKGSALVQVVPIKAPENQPLYRDASALLVLNRLNALSGTSERLFQQAFQLTQQEVRVAFRLARGETLDEIGQTLKISRETVRVHLKRLFAKTGTNRQAQLVRLITMMAS